VYLSPQNMAPADRLDDIIDKQVEPDPTPTAPMPAQRDDAQVAALMADAIRAALAEVEARVADTTEKYVAAEADRSILRSDRDALLARMTEEQAEAGRLKAALLIATERADHLALKQDAARMAEATATAERDAAQAEVAQLKVLHAEAHARADALQVERDTVQASYAEATATAEQASAAHSQALIDLQTGADSERAALTQRVEELRTLLTSAESVRDERAVELDKRSDALALAQAQTVALAREVQTLTDAATAAQVRADEAIAETATVRTSADEALATQAAALAAEQAEKAALAKQLADVRAYADTVEATLKATQAEAEAAKVSAATSASLAATIRMEADGHERETAMTAERLAGEQTARALAEAAMSAFKRSVIDHRQKQTTEHRAVMAVAVAKFVRVERDRAMRNCGSPAKLKAWAESFYLLHVDSVVEGLLPLMRAHLAFIESDADADVYTRAIVEPHLRAAKAQILAIADGDPEEFQVSLERLMTRWEHDRPAAIADAILQEEVTYVRSL
jgi:hypothetical protein